MKNDVTVTLNCNNSCIFCPRNHLESVYTGSYKKTLNVLKKLRKAEKSVVLTGGEVTIIPEFFKILRYCRTLGFTKIGIISNGRMFSNKEFLLKMLRGGVTDITVSVYSHLPKIHDKITRVEGSCEQTWSGIKNIMEITREFVFSFKINLVISFYNYKSVYQTIIKLYSLNVKNFLLIGPIEMDKNHILSYKKILDFNDKLINSRMVDSFFCFRGYPLCIFNKKGKFNVTPFDNFLKLSDNNQAVNIFWEKQDIDTHMTVCNSNRQKYLKDFSNLFKKMTFCENCTLNAYCYGVQNFYLKKFGTKDFHPLIVLQGNNPD